MKYSELRESLGTGDIVLFSGGGLFSAGIRFGQRLSFPSEEAKWSHVGMIIRDDRWNFVLLLESTTLSDTPDLESGKMLSGVQLVPMSHRVRTYDGEIAVRHADFVVTPDMEFQLAGYRSEISGRPYERDYLQLVGSAVSDTISWKGEDLSSMFCSETVIEGLQAMGVVDRRKLSNDYCPAHCAGAIPGMHRDFSYEAPIYVERN